MPSPVTPALLKRGLRRCLAHGRTVAKRALHGGGSATLNMLLGLGLLVIILVGLGIGRLIAYPISLAFILPQVEQVLSDPATGRYVSILGAELIWDGAERSVMVAARGIAVFTPQGRMLASVPEVEVRMSLPAMLRGTLAPGQVIVRRPRLEFQRGSDGSLRLLALPELSNQPAAPKPAEATPAEPASLTVTRQEVSERIRQFLREVRIVDAMIVVDDQAGGGHWEVPKTSARLRHVGNRYTADIAVELEAGPTPVRLGFVGGLDPVSGAAEGRIILDHLSPAAFAARFPQLPALAVLDAPLSGSIDFTANQSGEVGQVRFAISTDGGRVLRADLPGGAAAFNASNLIGRYASAEGANPARLEIEQFAMRLGAASIDATATVLRPLEQPSVQASLTVRQLPIDDFGKLWPSGIAVNPRRWILANITTGTVREATIQTALEVAAEGGAVQLRSLDGSFSVNGAKVSYFGQLPPIEGVAGTGKFDATRLEIAVTSGNIRRIKLDSGKVTITDFDKFDQIIAIEAAIQGPVAEQLAVVDSPPLGFIKRFGLAPQTTGGEASTKLQFRFPLINRLKLEDVDLLVTVDARGAQLPKVVREFALTDGNVGLRIDRNGLDMKGSAKLADVPITLVWRENFADRVPFRRRYEASGVLAEADRQRIGLEPGTVLKGPVSADIVYTDVDARQSTLSANLGLRAASLEVEEFGWTKPVGEPATAKVELALADGKMQRFSSLEFEGAGLKASGSGRFDDSGRLTDLDIRRATLGETDVAARVTFSPASTKIALTGRSLDATALLAADTSGPQAKRQPMDITARLDRVILSPGLDVSGLTLDAANDGSRWARAKIDARAGAGPVSVVVTPGRGFRTLSVTAADAGEALRRFGITEYVKGGHLKLDGRFDDSGPSEVLKANLEMEDYRLVQAPVLAQILAVASVTGIPELLTGEGIAFGSMTAEITRTDEALTIKDGLASGLAMGLTAEGQIGRSRDFVNLTGTVVPIYSISRVIGAIPLLGDLLTGGPGQGLFAFTWAVAGTRDKPTVSVNPLSVLAPGFVRNLFQKMIKYGDPGGDGPPPIEGR